MLRYSQKVLDHFHAPRHVGRLDVYDGISRLGDPDCGDFLEVTVRLSADQQNIAAIGYLVKGCPAAIATSSITAEMVCGKEIEEAAMLTDAAIIEALDGLPPGKEHCSVLAVKGLQLALQNAVLRHLFKRAGIVDSDEAFDRLVESGGLERYIHTCDGSCEEAPETCSQTTEGEKPC
ncbi:MAG TPA: iron-sulfur cluster assembly scaffold protein [Candidatus Ozemobacteraceae bacterium]|nr:iron-sulfur cluster assembly scaffold protein [Candidatus Ozemobacteraceae bacterium]HQG29822.1 iron-sulfur cluster assembly scaffold protein [Candidatus Ozemobacteraceae bacterium]